MCKLISFLMLVNFSLLRFFFCFHVSVLGASEILSPVLGLLLVAPSLFDNIFESVDTSAHASVHLRFHSLNVILHKLPKAGQKCEWLIESLVEVSLIQAE